MSGSVWLSEHCHYCPKRADSIDHIVPRMLLPKPLSRLPYWFRARNEVSSCKDCNNKKGHSRGSCYCKTCVSAWVTAKTCGFIVELSDSRVAMLIEIDEFYIDYLEVGWLPRPKNVPIDEECGLTSNEPKIANCTVRFYNLTRTESVPACIHGKCVLLERGLL